MKTKISYSLLAAAMACGIAQGAATAYTTPVGYVSLGDTTPGQPAIKAATDVHISIPLDRATKFAGAILSVSGNEITLKGTPGLPSYTGTPHTLTITSGSKSGTIGLITANTATTVTVTVANGVDLAGVVLDDTCSISEAWTVLGLMGTTLPNGTQLFAYAESAPLNPAPELIFEWDGSNWVDLLVSGDPADNTVLYPTETLVIRNVSASPITSFVVSGEVPTSNSRAVFGAGPSDNASSFFSPVSEPIGTSGLSAVALPGDQVLGYDNSSAGQNKAPSTIHEWDGSDWVDLLVSGDPENTFPLGAGKGFFFRRASGGSGTWSNLPSYVPSL